MLREAADWLIYAAWHTQMQGMGSGLSKALGGTTARGLGHDLSQRHAYTRALNAC